MMCIIVYLRKHLLYLESLAVIFMAGPKSHAFPLNHFFCLSDWIFMPHSMHFTAFATNFFLRLISLEEYRTLCLFPKKRFFFGFPIVVPLLVLQCFSVKKKQQTIERIEQILRCLLSYCSSLEGISMMWLLWQVHKAMILWLITENHMSNRP